MNGIHDLGGMQGFGPIVREDDEPVFHAEWERHVFAVAMLALGGAGIQVDEMRHAIERMPAADYLTTTYYEHWLHACETLLLEKGVITAGELDRRVADLAKTEGV